MKCWGDTGVKQLSGSAAVQGCPESCGRRESGLHRFATGCSCERSPSPMSQVARGCTETSWQISARADGQQVARSRSWAAGPAQRKGRQGPCCPCPSRPPQNHPRSHSNWWPRVVLNRKEVLGAKTDELQKRRWRPKTAGQQKLEARSGKRILWVAVAGMGPPQGLRAVTKGNTTGHIQSFPMRVSLPSSAGL